MKFKGTLRAPQIRTRVYQKVLRDYLAGLIADAAWKWLGAVMPHVPVWSGASAATFMPLAAELGHQLQIQPLLYSRGSRVNLGQQNADAEVTVAEDGSRASFTYYTTLAHLIWNEYRNANIDPDPTKWPPPAELIEPGPYHFQEFGRQAFEDFSRDVSLPDPFDYITVREYRVR